MSRILNFETAALPPYEMTVRIIDHTGHAVHHTVRVDPAAISTAGKLPICDVPTPPDGWTWLYRGIVEPGTVEVVAVRAEESENRVKPA